MGEHGEKVATIRLLVKYRALKYLRDKLFELQEELREKFGVRSTDPYVIDAKLLAMEYELKEKLRVLGLREEEIEQLLHGE